MLADFKAGLRVFQHDKKLFYLVLAQALCMFFYAPLSSFYPLMTSDYFDLSALHGSAAELCFALGMIVSSLLFSSVLKVRRQDPHVLSRPARHGAVSAACGLRRRSLRLDGIRGAVHLPRRLRQRAYHPADRLYPGNRRGRRKWGGRSPCSP